MLPVPGAVLHYCALGKGPLLLVLQGGAADAHGSAALAAELADSFTMVSFDRRGLSQSTIDQGAAATTIETHADDAYRLLVALDSMPCFVFGSSIGALIGLELVAQHPDRVRLLVAHEVPYAGILDEPERSQFAKQQKAVDAAFRQGGLRAAMPLMIANAEVRADDREPDVVLQPDPARAEATVSNLAFFFGNDAPAVHRHQLDLPALTQASSKVISAAGVSTPGSFPARCAKALAVRIGARFEEFPGGHNGYVARPRSFAARLRDVLLQGVRSDPT
jgi:pimeloyl-ACP methyl ester carboxylesterase